MEKTKMKLLGIMEILNETCEEHPLTANQICSRLEERGITAERKSVSRDIRLLADNGLDVIMCPDKKKGCYIGSRQFEDWELKVLIDGVCHAGFLTNSASNTLISKLLNVTSRNSSRVLRSVTPVFNHSKTANKTVRLAIDTTLKAISLKSKITFKYVSLGSDMHYHYRKDGALYSVSPYSMIWSDSYYYLICNTDGHSGLSYYRLDRIRECAVSDEKVIPADKITGPKPQEAINEFVANSIHSYSGRHIFLNLRIREDMLDHLADQFGRDIIIKPEKDSEYCRATVSTSESPGLYFWLLQFGENIEVLSPKAIRQKYITNLQSILARYQD